MSEPIQTRRRKLCRSKIIICIWRAARGHGNRRWHCHHHFLQSGPGVSPAPAGTAFLIASVVDAISDPLIGSISDRFRSVGDGGCLLCSPLHYPSQCLFIFYQPLEELSETGYFIWLVTFLILLRLLTNLLPYSSRRPGS